MNSCHLFDDLYGNNLSDEKRFRMQTISGALEKNISHLHIRYLLPIVIHCSNPLDNFIFWSSSLMPPYSPRLLHMEMTHLVPDYFYTLIYGNWRVAIHHFEGKRTDCSVVSPRIAEQKSQKHNRNKVLYIRHSIHLYFSHGC